MYMYLFICKYLFKKEDNNVSVVSLFALKHNCNVAVFCFYRNTKSFSLFENNSLKHNNSQNEHELLSKI